MTTSTAIDRPGSRRRRVAVSVSALGAGVALAGLPAGSGVAHAAAPRATHRVLVTAIHVTDGRSRRVELQSVSGDHRYQLISQYGRNDRVDYRTWQKDALGAREHAVRRVEIRPDERTWTSSTRAVAPLPPVSFGIQSTGAQVARAIRDGAAHEDGIGMKDGRRVRLLTLAHGRHVRSALLWVDPSTLAPVASTTAYAPFHPSAVRIVSSRWETVTAGALHRLQTAPKVPAGYRITHS